MFTGDTTVKPLRILPTIIDQHQHCSLRINPKEEYWIFENMLGALKFIPRDEVERKAGEKESTRGRSKERKHKDKDKAKRKSGKKRARSSDSEGTGRSGSASHESDRELEASAGGLREDAKARRKDAGLGWMLNAPDRPLGISAPSESAEEKPPLDSESHARELNPYLAAGAEENGQQTTQRAAIPMIGDGGASWRLKALRRAQERAAREGGRLDEIVEERWGSLGALTGSVATKRSAHANAHLHAIRDRRSRTNEGSAEDGASGHKEAERRPSHGPVPDRRGDDNRRYSSQIRVPRPDASLSWKSKKKFENQPLRDADAAIVRAAATTFNKYSGDGSFLKSFETDSRADHSRSSVVDKSSADNTGGQTSTSDSFDVVFEPTRVFQKLEENLKNSSSDDEKTFEAKPVPPPQRIPDGGNSSGLSANQVAAKAMRLRLSGKAKEADELLKDFEAGSKDRPPQRPSTDDFGAPSVKADRPRQASSHGLNMTSVRAQENLRARNQSYDAEMAGSIARNKSFKGNVDDEYDNFGNRGMETELVLLKKANKKKAEEKGMQQSRRGDFRHIATQQEQCQFCFENPRRPKHLVIAIANFVYLMLPPSPSSVPFHCYIVPMQHDGASRNVDENVWQEFRNFKKCLVQMFGKQGKGVLFLETAMKLPRQRRHSYIECIPVPSDLEKDAPLYFKKAIDEAEDEWSQHNAKKLIDSRQKGLRNSIPKNFPYFHVEFGIQGGYAHVIDDETSFKPQFGWNVVAGMLELEEEGRRKQDSIEQQRVKVKEFLKLWEPFDWTKMLDEPE